jgi:hypothetical protein
MARSRVHYEPATFLCSLHVLPVPESSLGKIESVARYVANRRSSSWTRDLESTGLDK